MTPENFCYWLKGYFEIENLISKKPDEQSLAKEQVKMIKKHLDLLFLREIDIKDFEKIDGIFLKQSIIDNGE